MLDAREANARCPLLNRSILKAARSSFSRNSVHSVPQCSLHARRYAAHFFYTLRGPWRTTPPTYATVWQDGTSSPVRKRTPRPIASTSCVSSLKAYGMRIWANDVLVGHSKQV